MWRLAVLAAALLVTACPGGRGQDESRAGPHKTSITTANSQSVPERSTTINPGSVVPAAAAAQKVQVQLTEYEIRMPDALPAGPTNFHIANAGKRNHNFAIEGNGLQMKLSSDLTRGDWASLIVELKAGTYTVYCPVDGHRRRGMQRVLTVK